MKSRQYCGKTKSFLELHLKNHARGHKSANMNANVFATERKDRKKGMFVSFFLHLSIIAIGLFPFLTNNPFQQPDETAEVVLVDFTDFKPASKEGAKPKAAKADTKAKQNTKKAVPKAKPVPKPKPTPVKTKKPVLTAPQPEIPIKTTPKVDKAPKESPIEKPTPVEVPDATEDTDADEAEDAKDAKDASSSASTASSSEEGSGTGSQGNGTHSTGTNWGEMMGDGIFNRKVIYRADVKKITRKAGVIVVNLCINRDGRVVMAKAKKDECTIRDNDIIRKAVNLTTRYRFERDASAPSKQCGKLTYVFEYGG